jgi:peptide chain release factor subunit 1
MEPTDKQDEESLMAIEIFKMKKLFKRLETAKISGSVVTIIIPPKKQISEITNMLNEETGKASNIKDRTNRNSVIEAQNSAR